MVANNDIESMEREAWRLERESRDLYDKVGEIKRRQQMAREKAFEDQTGIDVYWSNDYAGLKSGRYRFYYGYEHTVPPEPDDDDEDAEWAFVAWVDGEEVMRLPTSEVHPSERENMIFYLLAGIGHFLRDR